MAKKYEGMIAATDQLEVEKSKMQELKVNKHYKYLGIYTNIMVSNTFNQTHFNYSRLERTQ